MTTKFDQLYNKIISETQNIAAKQIVSENQLTSQDDTDIIILHENFTCGYSLAKNENNEFFMCYNNFDEDADDYYVWEKIPVSSEEAAYKFFDGMRGQYSNSEMI